MSEKLNLVCLSKEDLLDLCEMVVKELKAKDNSSEQEWVDTNTTMSILGISSKTTLQSLRNEGKIRFSQPMKRVILYYKPSLFEYIEKHTRETF